MDIDRIRRRVRLRDLETLAAVVQAGGMRKASHALHLSPAAVSKAVGELELTLGLPLLERGRRGVTPTPFGEALVRRSKTLTDELQGALHELAAIAEPGTGEVRLGSMETLQAGLVAAAIKEHLREHPGVHFTVEFAHASHLIDHFLKERLVDFVIARPLSLPLPPGVDGEALFRDRLRVVVGLQHPLARRRRLDLADLMDETWILSPNEVRAESPVVEALTAQRLALPKRLVIGGSLQMRHHLLSDGRYVTVVPHSLLPFAQMRSVFRVLPIQLPLWRTATMILTLRGRSLGPGVLAFLARLRGLARPLRSEAAHRAA